MVDEGLERVASTGHWGFCIEGHGADFFEYAAFPEDGGEFADGLFRFVGCEIFAREFKRFPR